MPVIMINMFQADFHAIWLDPIKEKFANICLIWRRQFFDYLSNLPEWMIVILLVGVFENMMK